MGYVLDGVIEPIEFWDCRLMLSMLSYSELMLSILLIGVDGKTSGNVMCSGSGLTEAPNMYLGIAVEGGVRSV